MEIEVGAIVEGKVSGITNFGAFVDLPDGKTGMVHISEVAHTFVNEIKDYIKVGQTVKVKVLSCEKGKIALSIKQATPKDEQKPPQKKQGRKPKAPAPPVTSPGSFVWQSSKKPVSGSFEDMMSKFKQTSEDKISDLKKSNGESRGYSRRSNSSRR